ncbi:hypothetical protein B0J17DRAFT_754828 [Rhizoctonia solani]|nr:hypothetical protein B0J17DRAFT_754828 [Rhizoctonia solani]
MAHQNVVRIESRSLRVATTEGYIADTFSPGVGTNPVLAFPGGTWSLSLIPNHFPTLIINMTRGAARLSTPSTPSSHSSSRAPSLSSSPASTSSSLSRSPAQSSRSHTSPDKCWVPTLDQVSRADPDERARLFARLAREAEGDAHNGTPRYTSSRPSGYSSKIEIEDQEMFSEWIVDVAESPVTSSFGMSHGHVSDEVIAGWPGKTQRWRRWRANTER